MCRLLELPPPEMDALDRVTWNVSSADVSKAYRWHHRNIPAYTSPLPPDTGTEFGILLPAKPFQSWASRHAHNIQHIFIVARWECALQAAVCARAPRQEPRQ